jgi:tRNA pseudouridine65 synthase
MLEIVYQDEFLIAINKPHGLLVHRSRIASDAKEFALQMLRDQIGASVYPCHRIDRKTGGILLFALDKETEIAMQMKFQSGQMSKKYLAIVRGYTPLEMTIDYPLAKENGTIHDAVTHFKTVKSVELPIPIGKHDSSRYSLVLANPITGRMHQLRKHFAHIFHPIIGDRPHGCNKQNRYFKNELAMDTMLLHALQLEFTHPHTEQPIVIKAKAQAEFIRMMEWMNFTAEYNFL